MPPQASYGETASRTRRITLVDNANLFGRALARNGAVSLCTGNTITLP